MIACSRHTTLEIVHKTQQLGGTFEGIFGMVSYPHRAIKWQISVRPDIRGRYNWKAVHVSDKFRVVVWLH